MTAWEERLEELLKTNDLFPYALVLNKSMPYQAPPQAQALLSAQQGFEHFFKDMPFSMWDQWIPGTVGKYSAVNGGFTDLSVGGGLLNYQIGASSSLIQQAQYSIAAENLVGGYTDSWLPLPRGGRLPKNTPFNGIFTLGNAYNAGGGLNNGGIATFSLRGYRLVPKGRLNRPQFTREEILRTGKYDLRAYTYAQTVTVLFANGTAAASSPTVGPLASYPAQWNSPGELDCDFMIHRVRFRPQSPIALQPGQGAATIEPGIQNWLTSVQVGLQDNDQGLNWQGGQDGNGNSLALNPWTHWVGVDWNQYIAGQALGPPAVFFPGIQRNATQWVLNHPLTIRSMAQYNVMAQAPALPPAAGGPIGFANAYQVVMEVALEGELIIPK